MQQKNQNKQRSQRDRAYAALHRLLILQKIPEGERLREPHWAAELKVNRMALREAFARLEAEGLIERGPATGYFVPALSAQDITEIIQLRIALESVAIRELCRSKKGVREKLRSMAAACDQFERCMKSGYFLGAIEADRHFHELLIEAANLKRLAMLYQRAPLPLIHREVTDEDVWRAACKRTVAEHRALLKHLEKRDESAAIRQIEQHLDRRPTIPL